MSIGRKLKRQYAVGHVIGKAAVVLAASIGVVTLEGCSCNGTHGDPSSLFVITMPTDLHTTEAGGQVEVSVALASKPSKDVVVPVASSNEAEGTVSVTSLTFTKDNWNAPQSLTVTGVDDLVADGDQIYQVQFGPTVSDDKGMNGLELSSPDLTNVDNDGPGVLLSPASGPTREDGAQATFDVVLSSQPTADVVIALASDDTTEGTVGSPTLTFTADNWDAPQTVTVTGVDDTDPDGDVAYHVAVTGITGDDATYTALVLPAPVALVNVDDETAGFTLGPVSGPTTEGGGQATFTIRLNAEPTAAVTVNFASDDASEGAATATSLTFTSANWNAPQTITVIGVDDDLQDGNQPYNIAFTATTSSDAAYAALTPADVALSNTDNDSAGIDVSAISGPTTESGDQATFTIRLTAPPTADVTVNFASNDATEGTTAVSSLTFDANNWNAPQTVIVTGVDDALIDGDQPYAIVFSATTSTDAAYAALTPANVDVTNIDDESAGISVGTVSGPTTEAGGQATFQVVLHSAPPADVTLNFASSDEGEGTLTASSVTFTPANWNAPKTVTVTGVDDDFADGNQPYRIMFSATTSTDANYAALTPRNVELVNVDDDSPGFAVTAVTGPTTEAGGQASFTLRLLSEPTADVTVNFGSDDLTEGTLTTSSLTFTSANWNAPQTVTITGENDDVADGDQPYQIDFTATTSGDTAYAALTPANVDVVNTDDDSAGITVSQMTGPTTEAGGQASFSVVLTSEPASDVSLDFDSDDSTEGTVAVTTLTFTPNNWNAPQNVLVTGVNDDVADGDQPYHIAFISTTSTDAAYAAILPANVDAINTDDDSAGINVTSASGPTTEAGGQATVAIKLNSEPTADVTLHFASDDTTEGTLTISSLTFTASNWNAPQVITVTGVNDDVADGDQPYQIDFAATTSTDAAYAAITPANVDLINQDNDSAGINVSAISGATAENGTEATFSVVLNSEPVADVTVSFDSDDTTEGTVAITSLTFTASNWNAPQTVTVTGVDDAVADGDQPYQIDFFSTVSGDAKYAVITPANVDVTNTDDDSAGITVSPISGNTTEAGGTATFTVVLHSEPFAGVTVNFATDDATEGTAGVSSLSFDASNWNVPQVVTVTGVNDDVADGDQPYQIDFAATTSTDAAYAAITPANVDVINTDNDSAGIVVSAISGKTTEAGGTATFTAKLNSQPTANVTINFASNDLTEGTTGVTSLTFTASNWNSLQTVTVTGVNDAVADGDQPYRIDFSATTSTDVKYAAITPANINVINVDDDVAGYVVTAISGHTTELGGTATFKVRLSSQPTADVTLHFASNDLTEGVTNVTTLVFTSGNWNINQTVTVTGVDDTLFDGNITYKVVFTPTTSTDAAYAAIRPADITVVNDDYEYYQSCSALLAAQPGTPSGNYTIDTDLGGPTPAMGVYCDMTYQGGGWTNLDFTAKKVWLANGIFVQCVSLTANATTVTCDHPMFNNNPTQWLYHYRCDGGDTSGNYVLDHMGPLIGMRNVTPIGGFTSLAQLYIDQASDTTHEYCYISGQLYLWTDSPCATTYATQGNGNCAMNTFTLTH